MFLECSVQKRYKRKESKESWGKEAKGWAAGAAGTCWWQIGCDKHARRAYSCYTLARGSPATNWAACPAMPGATTSTCTTATCGLWTWFSTPIRQWFPQRFYYRAWRRYCKYTCFMNISGLFMKQLCSLHQFYSWPVIGWSLARQINHWLAFFFHMSSLNWSAFVLAHPVPRFANT